MTTMNPLSKEAISNLASDILSRANQLRAEAEAARDSGDDSRADKLYMRAHSWRTRYYRFTNAHAAIIAA